jgi:hypothetical protein
VCDEDVREPDRDGDAKTAGQDGREHRPRPAILDEKQVEG